jgi:hypothetical protein
VIVVSSGNDCTARDYPNVLVVLLSSRVDLISEKDVLVLPPDGGVEARCIAETDIVFTVDKRELSGPINGPRYRGTLMADTFAQVRALLRTRMDF